MLGSSDHEETIASRIPPDVEQRGLDARADSEPLRGVPGKRTTDLDPPEISDLVVAFDQKTLARLDVRQDDVVTELERHRLSGVRRSSRGGRTSAVSSTASSWTASSCDRTSRCSA